MWVRDGRLICDQGRSLRGEVEALKDKGTQTSYEDNCNERSKTLQSNKGATGGVFLNCKHCIRHNISDPASVSRLGGLSEPAE